MHPRAAWFAILLFVLLLPACARKAEPPAPSPKAAKPAPPPNLLQLTSGAVVFDRTGEATLDNSAVKLIDTDLRTAWLSPPGDSQQTITFALPVPTRIEQIGIVTTAHQYYCPKRVRFDLSLDGSHYESVGTFNTIVSLDPQLFRITPTTASYVRLSTVEQDRTLQINDVWVAGAFTAPPPPPHFDGCWKINGAPAVFHEQGAAVSGFLGGMWGASLDGGNDGHFFRFAWIRGAEYGLAAISTGGSPARLSGVVWHEEAIEQTKFIAPDWLGESAPCSQAPAANADVFRTFIDKLHYFPLYGLRFDEGGRLMAVESAATLDRVTAFLAANPSLAVRFKSHELTRSTSAENRAIAQQKANTLRTALQSRGAALGHVEFVVLGADKPRREADTAIVRAMYSSVELEVAR